MTTTRYPSPLTPPAHLTADIAHGPAPLDDSRSSVSPPHSHPHSHPHSAPLTHPFAQLAPALRQLTGCDAAAVLKLEGEALRPVSVDGLVDEVRDRRFLVASHPRLQRILESPAGLRFPNDLALPDPYDGLLQGQLHIGAVHDCMGAPLRHAGRVWGAVTLDALDPQAFAQTHAATLPAIARLLEAVIAAHEDLAHTRENAQRDRELSAAFSAELLRSSATPRPEAAARSAAMAQLYQEIDTVAPSDLSVLILGETGAGKEVVAQRLHRLSRRHARPMVHVNCAALPEQLADSELFGHKRGAYTGAVQDRIGKFELAHGGTLLLDEVGELPLPLQAKLLRVLQSGEIQRPGEDRALRVDVRVISATNRELGDEVKRGRFRTDLFHRLSVFPIRVPPLRERGRDVLALAGQFLEENQQRLGARNLRLTPESRECLLAHDWPGNVRELEHGVSRAALRAVAEQGRSARWVAIEPRHLALEGGTLPGASGWPVDALMHPAMQAAGRSDSAAHAVSAPAPPTASESPPGGLRAATDAFQARWVAAALKEAQGAMPQAARLAGMDRSNFHRLVKRLGLAPEAPPKPR